MVTNKCLKIVTTKAELSFIECGFCTGHSVKCFYLSFHLTSITIQLDRLLPHLQVWKLILTKVKSFAQVPWASER